MWLLFACGSALFAGVTAVLAKIGMQHINSTIATALRTIIVLLFSWLMVLLTGAFSGIGSISGKTLVFLLLSGCATGAKLAVLLQGAATGRCEPGRSHRQIQHHSHNAAGVPLAGRVADMAETLLYAAHRRRNIPHAAQTQRRFQNRFF